MASQNVEIVRRALEAWIAGDAAAALAPFHEEVVTRRVAPSPDPGTWHRREALAQVVTDWAGMFEEFELRAEDYIDAGDQVVVPVAQEGRGRGSSVPVTATFWFVYSLRDWEIVGLDMYTMRGQAFEAAGISE